MRQNLCSRYFFFSSRRRHTRWPRDWSSDVCSSDLSSTRSLGDTSWESFDSFTAPSSGEYEIDCAGMPVAVGPPVSIGGILGAVGGVLFAIGGGFLGFVLLAIGIVLWLLNRKKTEGEAEDRKSTRLNS